MAKTYKTTPGRYHVTEIINPPQQAFLKRSMPYYDTPEGLIWLTFGSAWHGVIEGTIKGLEELNLADRFEMEKKLKKSYGVCTLTGRADLYDKETKTLWDFKTTKGYWVKKMHETNDWSGTTYHQQLNIYRWMGFPDCKTMKLKILVKDWSNRMEDKDGVFPIEEMEVPWIDDKDVEELVSSRLDTLMAIESKLEEPPKCLEADLWLSRRKEPLRCLSYCPVNNYCTQYQDWIKERIHDK